MANENREQKVRKANVQTQEHSINFMLAEYQRLNTLYQSQVERGERRVEFLITSASALFGFLAVLSQFAVRVELFMIITIGSLAIVSMFGLLTLNRLITRAATIHAHMKRMSTIRSYFIDLDQNVSKYLDIPGQTANTTGKGTSYLQRFMRRLLARSGLIETVILLNSIMISALITVIFHYLSRLSLGDGQLIVTSLSSFFVYGIIQFAFARMISRIAPSIER